MKNKSLLVIIFLLVVAVAILGYYNQSIIANKDQSMENPELVIKFKSENIGTVTLETIKSLGEESFKATLRSSGAPPEEHLYTGVPMKNILNFLDKSLLDKGKRIIVRALDGYTSVFYTKEVMEEKNVYLIYGQDGKALRSRKNRGNGPLMVVAAKDRFGQRWCKYVIEVDIE